MESSAATPILPQSDDWGLIEHFLQVCCRTSCIQVRNCWRISIPKQQMNFERRSQGLLTLSSWVPVSKLTENNPVQQVIQRGFTIPHGGLTFHIGNVSLPGIYLDYDDPTSLHGLKRRAKNAAAGRRVYEFLLCKVCVGKSHLVEDPEKTEEIYLPPEYDTLYIYRKNASALESSFTDTKERGVLPQNVFHHEYIVRESSLVLPSFLVHFEFDADELETLALDVCESCMEEAATIWCPADEASFCEKCDAELHSVNMLSKRHIRVPVNEKDTRSSLCKLHKTNVLDSYCMPCRMCLCMICRTKGHHSTGDAANHHVVPLREAYRVGLQSSRKQDPAVALIKEDLLHQLSAVECLLKEVELNGTTASERVHALAQEALVKGQSLCEKKIHTLLSHELGCKRQLDVLEWLEEFLQKQEHELSPVDFLHSWVRHCQVRRDLFWFPLEETPMPNLRLEGGLKVTTCPVEVAEVSKNY